MFKRYVLGVATAAIVLGGTQLRAAQLPDELMDIVVTIVAGCSSVSVPPELNMGSLAQGGAGEAQGNIVVTCGTGVDYAVAVEGGNNDAAGSRRMTDFTTGTNFIPYKIVSGACASPTEAGTTGANPAFGYTPTTPYVAGNVITGTGDGSAQNVSVCAKVTAADTMTVPADTYTDQVRVVVAF